MTDNACSVLRVACLEAAAAITKLTAHYAQTPLPVHLQDDPTMSWQWGDHTSFAVIEIARHMRAKFVTHGILAPIKDTHTAHDVILDNVAHHVPSMHDMLQQLVVFIATQDTCDFLARQWLIGVDTMMDAATRSKYGSQPFLDDEFLQEVVLKKWIKVL